ncbi:MAG: amino acid kinase family protein [bacterium]
MNNIKVFKVGGSVLSEPEDFLKIAQCTIRFRDSKICLVTSAIKGQTDELIRTYTRAIPKPDFYNFEKFVGMGEVQSALIFESAFKYLGKNAKAILPGMREWPIHISLKSKVFLSHQKINEKRDFVILPKAKKIAQEYLLPLLKKNIIIIPGFIAQDEKGHSLTLGRGGSDITALLMAELLQSTELILVKDVGGILSMDPKIVSAPKTIRKLSWEELGALAASGAQVLNPISLKHRKKLPKLRVISNSSRITKKDGTEVFFDKTISVISPNKNYGVLTFIGEKIPETSGILSQIASILAQKKIAINSITISDNLLAIYVLQEKAEIVYKLLSPLISRFKNLKALNLKKNIAKIVIRSLNFINEPGAIKNIVVPIAREKINIWEVLTVHTDIMVFVESQDCQRAYKIIKQLLRKERNGKW